MDNGNLRTFDTGATRDTATNKPDYEGYLSPLVLGRFGQYMLKHQKQSDGTMRESDNWQKGIPQDAYIKSAFRHFMEWWTTHRAEIVDMDDLEDTLCALMFNVMGYLHEHLRCVPQCGDCTGCNMEDHLVQQCEHQSEGENHPACDGVCESHPVAVPEPAIVEVLRAAFREDKITRDEALKALSDVQWAVENLKPAETGDVGTYQPTTAEVVSFAVWSDLPSGHTFWAFLYHKLRGDI